MALMWYQKNQRCGGARCNLQDLHDVMYMSINHGKTIDDFKERGKVVVRGNFHKHRLGDAWTNYF
jgi:flavin reductase (DIM6/NTAB) family NADH-FMN oxidoreductase RutF